MVQQDSRDAVGEGPVGSFWFGTWTPGRVHRYLWLKLPGGGIVTLPVGLNKPEDGPSWQWDGDEAKPTLHPSVWYLKNSGRADEWHGWIRAGRMVSV